MEKGPTRPIELPKPATNRDMNLLWASRWTPQFDLWPRILGAPRPLLEYSLTEFTLNGTGLDSLTGWLNSNRVSLVAIYWFNICYDIISIQRGVAKAASISTITSTHFLHQTSIKNLIMMAVNSKPISLNYTQKWKRFNQAEQSRAEQSCFNWIVIISGDGLTAALLQNVLWSIQSVS